MALASATAAAASPEALAAYNDGQRLNQANSPADAAHRFDDAIRIQPDYIDAYLGRSESRRLLLQYDLSLQDCAKILQLNPDDARGGISAAARHTNC